MIFIPYVLSAILSFASALPIPKARRIDRISVDPMVISAEGAPSGITIAQLLKIAPSSISCDGRGKIAEQCRTAAEAVPLLNAAHKKFNITTKGEVAALVSLQAFESGEFKFDRNQAGNPGQARNEMNFPFIYQYALDTPATREATLALVPERADLSAVSSDIQNQVLALMLPDGLSFASAAWFLKRSKVTSGTNCDKRIISGLQAETKAGWEAYITKCVGTPVTPQREAVYEAALDAL